MIGRVGILSCLAIFVLALNAGATPTAAASRRALLVGNSSYVYAPRLKNPPADVHRLGQSLGRLGFDVTTALDLGVATFRDTISRFSASVMPDDLVLLFYAGHGVQIRQENYFIPADFDLRSTETAGSSLVSMQSVLADLVSRAPAMIMFFIDACRDNPFSASIGGTSGLSAIDASVAEVLISFATSPGQVASDGDGTSSPYALALSETLALPNATLDEVLRELRARVMASTAGRQVPWVSGAYDGGITLRTPELGGPAAAPTAQPKRDWLMAIAQRSYALSRDPRDARLVDYLALAADTATRTGAGAAVADVPAILGLAPNRDRSLIVATNDRIPPPSLGEWPVAALTGLDSGPFAPTDCDWVAADPDDTERIAPGIASGAVDTARAIRACTLAAVQAPGSGRLLYQLGRALDIAQRFDEARRVYVEAASLGASAAELNLGYMYEMGRGVDASSKTAAVHYMAAAADGNLRARNALGGLFERGSGVPQSATEAFRWYALAAWSGWPDAMDNLANLYRRGGPVAPDPARAAELYGMAASARQTNAMNNLARAYRDGEGVAKDISQSIALLRKATDLGNLYAPFNLARHYERGWGVAQDTERARALYEMAADRGFAGAYPKAAELGATLARSDGERIRALAYAYAAEAFGTGEAEAVRVALVERLPDRARETARRDADRLLQVASYYLP